MHSLRVFKTNWFARFALKARIRDDVLRDSIRRAERGLVDANLGGGVIKQRIARQNRGRSGGYRSIVLFRAGQRAFFVYGFPKGDRSNITNTELEGFKELATEMLGYDKGALEKAIESGALQEVKYDEHDQEEASE